MKKNIIKIPHLNVQIVVDNIKKDSKYRDIKPDAYTERLCSEEYRLVIPPVRGKKTASILVHEIMHIIQHLVEDNNMRFSHEREHMAYIAGYIFEQVCDMKL